MSLICAMAAFYVPATVMCGLYLRSDTLSLGPERPRGYSNFGKSPHPRERQECQPVSFGRKNKTKGNEKKRTM
jgi:hypothetical protein